MKINWNMGRSYRRVNFSAARSVGRSSSLVPFWSHSDLLCIDKQTLCSLLVPSFHTLGIYTYALFCTGDLERSVDPSEDTLRMAPKARAPAREPRPPAHETAPACGPSHTICLTPALFLYIRVILSSVFFVSALYKLAYLNLDTLTKAYYSEDGSVPNDVLSTKPIAEFWPGVPCAARIDDALRFYLFLPPWALAKLRPWYPIAFLAGAVIELIGAITFVAGRREGARTLLLMLGIVTLVIHPVWDGDGR
jgi:hypothetical protein